MLTQIAPTTFDPALLRYAVAYAENRGRHRTAETQAEVEGALDALGGHWSGHGIQEAIRFVHGIEAVGHVARAAVSGTPISRDARNKEITMMSGSVQALSYLVGYVPAFG